jgi:O-antigen/teichoic acid export membrane protein
MKGSPAKKSKSLAHQLLAGSTLRVISLFVSAVTSFFLMPFVVHQLGDRVYGFWTLAAAFIGYYELLDFGLSSAVSQYISVAIGRSDQNECRAVFNAALRIQTLLGVVALLATAILAILTPRFCHNPADAHIFWKVVTILGVNAALGFPIRTYSGVLGAELRFDIQACLTILGLLLRTGLVVLVLSMGGGLLSLAWVTLLATLPVNSLQVWFARREASWCRIGKGFFKRERARSLFSYSVYTFLSYLADIIRFQIDPLVISGLIGLAAVTHYRVAGVFAQYYVQVVVVSVGMLQPVLSRLHGAGNQSRLDEIFFLGTKLSSCISIFMCIALAGWGKPFITRWMGSSYEDGYWPLVVLSLGVLLDVCQRPSIDLLYATFKHRFYTYINWAEGILNLAFSVALARPLGILGVAMGTLIAAFLIRVVLQPWWVCKVSGIQYGHYMKFFATNLVRCALVACVATLIAAWGLRPNYFWLITSAICATAVYAAGSWVVVLNGFERQLLLSTLLKNDRRKQNQPEAASVAV